MSEQQDTDVSSGQPASEVEVVDEMREFVEAQKKLSANEDWVQKNLPMLRAYVRSRSMQVRNSVEETLKTMVDTQKELSLLIPVFHALASQMRDRDPGVSNEFEVDMTGYDIEKMTDIMMEHIEGAHKAHGENEDA